ncbi:unnamed protein product [Ixodes pacificus]
MRQQEMRQSIPTSRGSSRGFCATPVLVLLGQPILLHPVHQCPYCSGDATNYSSSGTIIDSGGP